MLQRLEPCCKILQSCVATLRQCCNILQSPVATVWTVLQRLAKLRCNMLQHTLYRCKVCCNVLQRKPSALCKCCNSCCNILVTVNDATGADGSYRILLHGTYATVTSTSRWRGKEAQCNERDRSNGTWCRDMIGGGAVFVAYVSFVPHDGHFALAAGNSAAKTLLCRDRPHRLEVLRPSQFMGNHPL